MRLAPKKFVVEGNLAATLKSIRAANKHSIIRYVDNPHTSSIKPYNPSDLDLALNQVTVTHSNRVKRRRHPTSFGCEGRALLLTSQKTDELWKRHKIRSPIANSSVQSTSNKGVTRSSAKIYNVQINPQSETSRKLDSISPVQYPYLATISKTLNDDRYTQLSGEIENFCDGLTPTASQSSMRKNIVTQVQEIIAETLPDLRAEVFGSERVGLATSNSDIDFALWHADTERGIGKRGPSPTRPFANKVMLRRLQKLSSALGSHSAFERPSLIYARYPLAQATHCKSGLDVQIIGMKDSVVSQEYVKAFQSEFPELRSLYHVIKEYLRREGLTDVYKGGLGSYTVFMMIVAFLKLRSSGRGLGYQLIEFLEFYSSFDTTQYALTIDPPAIVEKRAIGCKYAKADRRRMLEDTVFRDLCRLVVQNQDQPRLFCIQDPADSRNDLGKRNFAVKAIKESFRTLAYALKTRLGSATTYRILPLYSKGQTHPLLMRDEL